MKERQEMLLQEETMFQVTEKASEMIKDHLKDQEELPAIRIFLNPGG
jgi:Fe-S cluster assembly iron-binding protein IscA